jgi:hypothetical protein
MTSSVRIPVQVVIVSLGGERVRLFNGCARHEGVVEGGIRVGRKRHECEIVVEPGRLVRIPKKDKTELRGNADVSKEVFLVRSIIYAERSRRNWVAPEKKRDCLRAIR